MKVVRSSSVNWMSPRGPSPELPSSPDPGRDLIDPGGTTDSPPSPAGRAGSPPEPPLSRTVAVLARRPAGAGWTAAGSASRSGDTPTRQRTGRQTLHRTLTHSHRNHHTGHSAAEPENQSTPTPP